jgi:transposase
MMADYTRRMPFCQDSLPDDIAMLKAMLAEHSLQLEEQTRIALDLRQQLDAKVSEIDALKLLIAKLRRMQFGHRSEKLERQIEQLELQLDELLIAQAPLPPAPERVNGNTPKPVRKPLPSHLPRVEHVHLPDADQCPDCGGALKALGEDVAEQLEYVPASFRVIRHKRPKLACACCDTIVQALAPSRPIERGLAGLGLLAHVLVSKFADHLPLYRQSVIFARQGVELDRSTLADWVAGSAALLRPLVEAIRRHVLAAGKLHVDDTPVPVLAPGRGKTRTGRLWTYVRDDRPSGSTMQPAVWFAYSPDRKGIHPQTQLSKYEGILQADAYAGFNALFETGKITEAACWAHSRRKFYDLHDARPSPFTEEALFRIGELYAIEAQI